MPKKRTATVARDRNGAGIEPWSRSRKGATAQPLYNPSSPDSMAALQATLNRTQEVMVKVTGGGKDTGTAQAHIAYIDRHGVLDIHTDEGELLNGKDAAKAIVDDWGLDEIIKGKQRYAPSAGELDKNGKPKRDSRPKLVHNIVLSMPQGTPPQAVLAAAQHFARENFALSHRYAMVLHDPATDPKHEKTQSGKNPHVHLVVKAVSETGERLYIRKDTLRNWREQFAQALRLQGVQANATPAAIRGKPKSDNKSQIHQHQERLEHWRQQDPNERETHKPPIPSELLKIKVENVLRELFNGEKPDQTGKAKLEKTRESVLKDWLETEKALRVQGQNPLADRVQAFINTLPPVKTAHDVLKEQMLADKDRLRAATAVIKPPIVDEPVSRGDDHAYVR
jgi:hypothetical protein